MIGELFKEKQKWGFPKTSISLQRLSSQYTAEKWNQNERNKIKI